MQDLVDREIWRIPSRLEVRPSFRIEDDVAAAELYRIAREAVINANKHSQAREIVVRLERVGDEMVLRVMDDGVGLSKEPKTRRGLGLHIMSYRAGLIGARLEIDSPKRGGTCVSCYLPDNAVQSKGRRTARQIVSANIQNGSSTVNRNFYIGHTAERRIVSRKRMKGGRSAP